MAKLKTWRGKEVSQAVAQNVALALGEFALRAEGHAKRELQKGHGVITGTLRRSIHTAQPGYNWNSDGGEGERGGKLVAALIKGNMITVQVGSGLVYAMAIHQGWTLGYKGTKGAFAGYHFLTIGVDKAKPEMPSILKEFQLR